MRFVPVVLLATVCGLAEEPRELVRCRQAYGRSVVRATSPIDRGYVKYLETLKRKYGKSGDATHAQVIQNEIERTKVHSLPIGQRIVGDWRLVANGATERLLTFGRDGSVTSNYGTHVKTWKHVRGHVYEALWKGGKTVKVELSRTMDGFTWVVEGSGAKQSFVRPWLREVDFEPKELVDVRAKYRSKIDGVAVPIMKSYQAKLETIKKALGSKGRTVAAMAVQDEIEFVSCELLAAHVRATPTEGKDNE